MAAPQIIINAILYPLEVAYRHGGHTQTCLRKSIPHHDSCSDAGAKRNAGDQALLDLVATARSKAMNMASCTKGDRMTSPGFECCQAAVGRSRTCSSKRRNSGFGARHMVRNVSRKGSQPLAFGYALDLRLPAVFPELLKAADPQTRRVPSCHSRPPGRAGRRYRRNCAGRA